MLLSLTDKLLYIISQLNCLIFVDCLPNKLRMWCRWVDWPVHDPISTCVVAELGFDNCPNITSLERNSTTHDTSCQWSKYSECASSNNLGDHYFASTMFSVFIYYLGLL